MRTHYDVLQVSASAPAEDIRASYRRLVMKYHPDRHQGNPLSELAAAELAALNQAHEVLQDAGRRAAYDAELASASGRRAGGAARADTHGAAGPGGATAGGPGEKRTLVLVLRILAAGVALLLALRFVPLFLRAAAEVWQVVAGSASALGGTPAAMAAVAVAVAAALLIIARRGRRRKGIGSR